MTRSVSRRALLAGASASAIGAGIVAAVGSGAGGATPLARNQKGAQWALLVEQAACARHSGCRACIDACHQSHSVPEDLNSRHAVRWLWKEPFAQAFPGRLHPESAEKLRQAPVLVLCNHCSNPPCAKVCPTGATWQRHDGVVAMDQHRCIGCRYCMVACPYDARSFNWQTSPGVVPESRYPRRSAGVVEKCTLCVERIDVGKVPLCVEACQSKGNGALSFGDINESNSEIRHFLASRLVVRRKPELGTEPRVYYLV